MKLTIHASRQKGLLLIDFDEEGRKVLLRDIENAIREHDHEFCVLEAEPTEPRLRGQDWKQVEFYNIVCKADSDTPLRVDDSVTISGGAEALTTLRDRINNLPVCCGSFELQTTESYTLPPRKKRPLIPWLIGGVFCAFFLHQACDRLIVSLVRGKDDIWFQMWCYFAIALAVLPVPWLISRHAWWSARLNAGLCALAIGMLLVLVFGVFGNPCEYFPMPCQVYLTLLCGAVVLLLPVGLLPLIPRGQRCATENEKQKLQQAGKLVQLLLSMGFLAVLLALASISYGIKFCYIQGIQWYDYPFFLPGTCVYLLPLWLISAYLPDGAGKKICYTLLTYTLLPSLLMAAPCYYMGLTVMGIEAVLPRILISLLPIATGAFIFPYLRRGMK